MSEADYSEYRLFLKNFQLNLDENDQLPVKLAGYSITESEVPGEIIDWTVQYLSQKNCPPSLFAPIIRTVMDEIKQACHETPFLCGFNSENNVYQPLKLMHAVTAQINNICLRLLDNSQLDKIPPPPQQNIYRRYAVSAVKNTRRKMEDRHVCIDDFNGVFGIENAEPTSYYAIFDGHGGQDAASYTVAHLHQHLAASKFYPSNPTDAIRDAFLATDLAFLEKCKRENLCSGTTALCVLYRPLKQTLYVGWVGDSQALLVRQGNIFQIVSPHKPEIESERKRIESQGGCVMRWGGLWRVNGTLAISRAIGDADYKPFVTGEPDITRVPLDGMEDFLIIACDGLWDFVTEDDAAITVYRQVRHDPDNIDEVTLRLVKLAKLQGSADNISVIVVFLKDPHQIATSNWPSAVIPSLWDYIETAYDKSATTDAGNSIQEEINPMSQIEMMDFECKTSNSTADVTTPELTKSLTDDHHENLNNSNETKLTNLEFCDFDKNDTTTTTITTTVTKTSNGKRSADELDDDDLGPETDVDALDENMIISKEIKEDYQFETKEKCDDINDMRFELNNPFNIADAEDSVKLDEFKISEMITDQLDDNKLRELNDIDETKVTSELVQEFLIKDLSEKRDNSFEKDEFESDIIGGIENNEIKCDFKLDGNFLETVAETSMETSDISNKGENMIDSINSQVLDTSVTEHVVGESAGEDSEDEWNYIKVDKTSEKKLENVEELHALSQGIAESQEACSDLLQEDDQEPEEELLQLEKTAAKEEEEQKKIIKEKNIENRTRTQEEEDEDNMSSQLNPDAKEFVPTSPVRSTPTSPFNQMQNGTSGTTKTFSSLNPQQYLLDDQVIAQSPRKGTPMENIALPSENEFDIDISSRPAEIEKTIDLMSGGDFNRPGSSCSQASYQEMNLKEAMHGDEKLDYAPEQDDIVDHSRINMSQDVIVTDQQLSNSPSIDSDQLIGKILSESDPMNMSFYQDKNDTNNPFDMNAVHRLPIDDDDEINKLTESSLQQQQSQSTILLEGKQGERFLIEDSDFGMNQINDFMSSSLNNETKLEENLHSHVSNGNNVTNNDDLSEAHQENNIESDQPESDFLINNNNNNAMSMLDAVKEMTNEVTSLLNTVNENNIINNGGNGDDDESPTIDVRFDAESFVENIKGKEIFDKYDESGLSPTVPASNNDDFLNVEKNMSQVLLPDADSPESDNCFHTTTNVKTTTETTYSPQSMEPQDGSYTTPVHEIIGAEIQMSLPIEPSFNLNNVGNDNILSFEDEISVKSPANDKVCPEITSPEEKQEIIGAFEQQQPLRTDDDILDFKPTPMECNLITVTKELKVEAPVEGIKVEKVQSSSAVKTATTAPKKATPTPTKGKITDSKKSDATKPKVAAPATKPTTATSKTTSSVAATKKTAVPLTSAPKTTTTTAATKPIVSARTTSLTAASKPTSRPASASTTSITKTKTVTSLPSSTKTNVVEKKTTTSAKQPPLTNGEVKPAAIRKPLHLLALAAKPATTVAAAPKSTVSAKPPTTTTTRTIKATTTTVASKPTSSSITKTTATTTKAPAKKPTTAPSTLAPKIKPITSATTPTKPKSATGGGTLDKQIKDTANIQVSSTRTITNTNATNKLTSSSPRSTVTTMRKTIDAVKSPIGTKSSTSSSSTKTTVTTTSSSVRLSSATTNSGAKKPTATQKTTITKKTTTSSPSKPNSIDNKTIDKKKVNKIVNDNKLNNGNLTNDVNNELIKTTTTTTTTTTQLIIDDDDKTTILLNTQNNGDDNFLIKKDDENSPIHVDNSQMIIIDSSAD